MLQEHLMQGDFHRVVGHTYLPCFWKSLTATCRKRNEFLLCLLCFRCTPPSASAASCCQRQIAMQVLWPATVPSFFIQWLSEWPQSAFRCLGLSVVFLFFLKANNLSTATEYKMTDRAQRVKLMCWYGCVQSANETSVQVHWPVLLSHFITAK